MGTGRQFSLAQNNPFNAVESAIPLGVAVPNDCLKGAKERTRCDARCRCDAGVRACLVPGSAVSARSLIPSQCSPMRCLMKNGETY